jgi:hypothetical protein
MRLWFFVFSCITIKMPRTRHNEAGLIYWLE